MKLIYSVSLVFALFFVSSSLSAESILLKSKQLRVELMQYLRQMKTMVNNFPCSPFPKCVKEAGGTEQGDEANFLKKYKEAQDTYQEGLIYYFEGNFLNAYGRFVGVQVIIDNVLEELSQSYLERARQMLRESIEKKVPEDPDDMRLSEVILEYGPDTQRRRAFGQDRELPLTKRSYKAKETHWMTNKYRLEGNLRMGYGHIALAKQARLRAFRVLSAAAVLPVFDEEAEEKGKDSAQTGTEASAVLPAALKEQEVTPGQRRKRIDHYLKSIHLCRKAKANAGFIFMLKYPYDNYALQNPYGQTEKGTYQGVRVPNIEDVRMNWSENPYLYLKKLHPVYDLRISAEFRRDLVDVRNEGYKVQMDRLVRLETVEKKPESFQRVSIQEQQRPQQARPQ